MSLSRVRTYTREKLIHPDLEASFNNIVSYINSFLVQNPLTSNLNFGSFDAVNFTTKILAHVVIASEYSTLNDAFDALNSDVDKTPRVLYMPPAGGNGTNGEYEITSGITVLSNTTVIGGGWDSIVKLTADPGTTIFDASSNSNVMFANFQIDGGNKQTSAVNGVGVSLTSSTDCIVKDVRIKDIGDAFSHGGLDGLLLDAASRVWISGCYITGCGRHGIGHGSNGTAGTDLFIHDNQCDENEHTGIDFEPMPSRLSIRGNKCSGNKHDGIVGVVEADDVTDVDISGNIVTDCGEGNGSTGPVLGGNGINVFQADADGGDLTNLKISNNLVRFVRRGDVATTSSVTANGISVSLGGVGVGSNYQITDNLIEDVGGQGIYYQIGSGAGTMRNVEISGNKITDACLTQDTVAYIRVVQTGAGTVSDISITDNKMYATTDGSGSTSPTHAINFNYSPGASKAIIDGNIVDFSNATPAADIRYNDPSVVVGTNFVDSIIYVV